MSLKIAFAASSLPTSSSAPLLSSADSKNYGISSQPSVPRGRPISIEDYKRRKGLIWREHLCMVYFRPVLLYQKIVIVKFFVLNMLNLDSENLTMHGVNFLISIFTLFHRSSSLTLDTMFQQNLVSLHQVRLHIFWL